MDAVTSVYLSLTDLLILWGLAVVVVALCVWALAETFSQPDEA